MTASQYRQAIAALGLDQRAAAKFLGVSLRTSNSYANGRAIPTAIVKLLKIMIETKRKPKR